MSITNIKNVELRWCYLAQPMNKGAYPSNKYQADIVFDSGTKKIIQPLLNKKQKIKDLGEGKYSVTLKSTLKPKVIDKSKKILSDDVLSTIGNGTKAIVQVNQYKGFRDELYLGLSAIKIIELKEYNSLDFGDDDEDYEYENSSPVEDEDDEPL